MLNETLVTSIQNIPQFIKLSHNNIVIPNLLLLYTSFIVLFLIFGLFVSNKESRYKFWGLFFIVILLTGGVLFSQIVLEDVYYDFFNKLLN